MSGEPTTLELLEQLAEYAATPSEARPHQRLIDAVALDWSGGYGPVGDNWAPVRNRGWHITPAGQFALLAWRAQPPA